MLAIFKHDNFIMIIKRIHFHKFPDVRQFTNDENGITQFLLEYNKILEQYIHKYPEQWFWMHRRWKSQPL